MININLPPSHHAAILGSIDPDNYSANTYTTGWIDMSKFASIMAIVQAGDLGSNATLDAKIEQDIAGDGAAVTDITGKAITQLTQVGTDSNKQAIINVHNDELNVAAGCKYVRLSITVGTATSDAAGIVLGFYPYSGFASDSDAAAVDEIVY